MNHRWEKGLAGFVDDTPVKSSKKFMGGFYSRIPYDNFQS